MTYPAAIFLGLLQGLTEFLPISSSGHLSVFQNFFNLNPAEEGHMFFDVLLHLGTLVSVCVVYWSDVKAMVLEFFGLISELRNPDKKAREANLPARRLILLLIVATLPLVAVLPFNGLVERLYYHTMFIGAVFLLTGCMLFISDRIALGTKNERTMRVRDAVLIGLCQCVAVVPGLSRSGTTITAGIAAGLDRAFAVRFAFLMSIPAVLGANLITLIKALIEGVDFSLMPVYFVGMAVSAVTGIVAIGLVKYVTQKGKFGYFAYYCWIIGALTILLSLVL